MGTHSSFGEDLAAARKRKCLTREKVAHASGLSLSTVVRCEEADLPPSLSTLRKLVTLFPKLEKWSKRLAAA